jgi:hypothetical protein
MAHECVAPGPLQGKSSLLGTALATVSVLGMFITTGTTGESGLLCGLVLALGT